MRSREKDQTTSHHPLLSSLVVRPTDSVDGGGATGGGGAGSDYEPGEVRRDPPPYFRSDRYASDDHAIIMPGARTWAFRKVCVVVHSHFLSGTYDQGSRMYIFWNGYRMRAGSVSPVRRSDADRRYSPGFDHSGAPPRGRGIGSGRDLGRYRESSPPYGRGRGGGRFGRVYDGPGYGPGPFRGEGLTRNNPNVRPREGDWVCPDPLCKNLNFARREHCNNCNRFRYAPTGSPRRGYPGPLPTSTRHFPGPPMDRSPGRNMNGYRSLPRGWARDGPRDFRAVAPPRNEGRFPDPPIRRDEPDFPVQDFRDRYRFDRPVPLDLGPRNRGRDGFISERRGAYERRPVSPPPAALAHGPYERRPVSPPPAALAHGQWARDIRGRSRSPVRGGPPPPKDYHRDIYMDRGRNDRRGMGREAF